MMNTMLKKAKKFSGKEVKKMRKLIIMLGLVSMVIVPRLSWAQVDVIVGYGAGNPGETVPVPIAVSNTTGLGIYGCDLELLYNPALLSVTDAQEGLLTSGWEIEVEPADTDYDGVMDEWEMKTHGNLTTVSGPIGLPAEAIWDYPVYRALSGKAEIALYGTTALAGAGTIANLNFQVDPAASAGTTFLVLKQGDLNEGPASLFTSTFDILGGGNIEGDINADGVITSADVRAYVNVFHGNPTPPEWISKADVNKDSSVNVLDGGRIVVILLYQ